MQLDGRSTHDRAAQPALTECLVQEPCDARDLARVLEGVLR
jgi:hypothetical protein